MEKTTLMSLSKLFSGPGGDYIMLASESDLRAYVLRQHLGITNILMLRSDFEENLTLEDGETPYNYAVKTADEKARIVADRVFNHEKKEGHEPFRNEVRSPFGTVPDNFDFTKVKYVVGADTVCLCNDVVFGKPGDERAARDQLHAYQKYDPVMVTGVSIYVKDEHAEKKMKRISSFYERTIVHFTALNDEEINAYISTGEYKGVAGSCNYTGLGETLIEWIEGSYTAAVGIPTHQFAYEICSHLKNGDNIQYLVDGDETGVKRVRARTKRPVGEKLQAALADEIQSTAVPTSEEESESPSESETEEEGEAVTTGQRARRGRRHAEEQPEGEVVPVNEEEGERTSEKGEESDEDQDEKEEEEGGEEEGEEMGGETEKVKSNEGSDVEAEEEPGRSAKQEEEEEDEEDEEEVEEDNVAMGENGSEQESRSRRKRSASVGSEEESLGPNPEESDNFEGSQVGSDEEEEEKFESNEDGRQEPRINENLENPEDNPEENFEDTHSQDEERGVMADETYDNGTDSEDLENVNEEGAPSSTVLTPRSIGETPEDEDVISSEGEGMPAGPETEFTAEEEEPRNLTQEEKQFPEGTEDQGEEEGEEI